MNRLYLKPVAGRACPDPGHGNELLPEAGGWVTNSVYWQRRIKDGDAVLADEPKPKKAKAATEGTEQ
ncbi:DUF2635 domain-containing protein [Pseudomonas sp. BGM005]|nr:DUF2635 domain-containing protein [Pseudomonas sp. BG5]